MKITAVELKLSDKTVQREHVKTKIYEKNGMNIVHVKGVSNATLYKNVNIDGDFGVEIDFDVDDAVNWMADYRSSEFWCTPMFGTDLCDVPDETQGLIYKTKSGRFGVVLPIVSEKYKCVLCGNKSGGVMAKLFSWSDDLCSCDAPAFLYAEGENPYELLKNAAKTGLEILNNCCRTREERRYPEIFEYLGWCSWDAMQIRVCEDDLIGKCEEFREKGIPVKWFMIDDMWGEVHDFYDESYDNKEEMVRLMHASKLYSFKADPIRFPNGLKGCIDKLKKLGIRIGMWHPTTGYWMGLDPEGEAYAEQKENVIKTADGRYVPSFEQDKAYMFYSSFHRYLRQCGADFIKVDNQSMTRRFYKNLAPVGVVARSFHNALEASAGQYFDGAMINCMGMASEDMWNRTVSPIARCSDDFQPESAAWFRKHIMQCAYNDLFQGQFYYCDWDMWWTDDAQATKNSILRAVSGGPIYVSDMAGRSRAEVLKPLIFSDGRILRCDRPAMPTADCLVDNPIVSGGLFKLQNIANNSGVLAVFNIDEKNGSTSGSISPSDIPDIEGEEFAIYEHFSRKLEILKKDERLKVELKNNDEFKLYIVVPMQDGFAPIGRTDKYISPKSVRYVSNGELVLIEDGEYAYVENRKLVIKPAKQAVCECD